MKVTEQTTLAELQHYLRACGDPFVTLMTGHPHGAHPRHAIIHVPEVGTFHGGGSTVAEALEAALIGFRRATLPESLKQYTDASGSDDKSPSSQGSSSSESERWDPTPSCAQCGQFAECPIHDAPRG